MTWQFFRLGETKWQHCPTRWMLVTLLGDSSVLDTEYGDVYIRRTARVYPIPPLVWHETHRNSSTIEWDMQWWRYGREKCAFVCTTVQRRPNAETFRIFRSSFKMVSTDPTDMLALAAICFTVKRWSSITICSTHTIVSSDQLVRGRGSFVLFSHDVRPSLNCRTHERTFFTSIMLSLHVSLNCWWILMGFMPRKWRNRIITRCSSNVNVAIFSI